MKMAKQKRAIEVVLMERAYQEKKWPGHSHTVAEWILILQKLLHDAERAWVTGHGDDQALHEIRKIAATAIACMEQCGSKPRGEQAKCRKYSFDELNPAD